MLIYVQEKEQNLTRKGFEKFQTGGTDHQERKIKKLILGKKILDKERMKKGKFKEKL